MAKRSAAPFTRRLAQARAVHMGGDTALAIRLYEGLAREKSGDPTVLHGLGVAYAQSGRYLEGEACLRQAIGSDPETDDYRFDLGALFDAQGRLIEAEAVLLELVERSPNHEEAWAAIGMYRRDRNERTAAGEAYARAYRARPEKSEYALRAAELLAPEAGAALLAECLEDRPQDTTLLLPLAELLVRADQIPEAETVLNSLLAREPAFAPALRRLSGVYVATRRYAEAIATLYALIHRDPDDADSWSLVAEVREAVGDLDGAAAALQRASALVPEDLGLIGRSARLHQQAASSMVAKDHLAELPKHLRERAEIRLVAGMLMPPILASNESIDALRANWMDTMGDVVASPTPITEPWVSVGLTGAYLGYQGREDRTAMEALSKAMLACSPHLEYRAENLEGSGERRLRVGFLSAHMRVHSVGRMLVRLMGALDRTRFEVVLLELPGKPDGGGEWGAAHAERTVRIETDLDAARKAIEAERLDVLLYCDLHLTPFADALAFSRLAPVQAATWGHPGTGGKTTIDEWISCVDWEPEGNERLYTERLVRLPLPPYVYDKPETPVEFRSRSSFGLADDARLYGCLQSPFKIHPDMDAFFAAILDRDAKGRIVLLSGPATAYERQLRRRFERTFDPAKVDFVPRVLDRDYPSVVNACDALLDPVHFGGANTTLDAFAQGKPVVTLRGDQMRNRATGGFYRRIGYESLVAEDAASYADLAVRLTHERRFAREAKEAILAGGTLLFDNLEPVSGFEKWLLQVGGRS